MATLLEENGVLGSHSNTHHLKQVRGHCIHNAYFVVICRKHAHCIVMHFSGVALWPWVLEGNSTKAAACDSNAMYLSSTFISKRYVLLDGNRHIYNC